MAMLLRHCSRFVDFAVMTVALLLVVLGFARSADAADDGKDRRSEGSLSLKDTLFLVLPSVRQT